MKITIELEAAGDSGELSESITVNGRLYRLALDDLAIALMERIQAIVAETKCTEEEAIWAMRAAGYIWNSQIPPYPRRG